MCIAFAHERLLVSSTPPLEPLLLQQTLQTNLKYVKTIVLTFKSFSTHTLQECEFIIIKKKTVWFEFEAVYPME
jgi:hypothetical protein